MDTNSKASVKTLLRPGQAREFSLLLLLMLIIAFFATQIENYFSPRMFNRISTSVAVIAVVAVGQTLVILTRNIDLSVGSIVGFAAYFTGTQLAAAPATSLPMAIAISLAVGLTLGLLNGALVAFGKVPSIIATLGTLALYRALLVDFANSKTVTIDSLPQYMKDLPTQSLLTIGDVDVRVLVGAAIAIVIAFQLVLGYTHFGRLLYAVGSNPDAARNAGLPATRTLMAAYGICGMLAGLGGFMFLARFGNITTVAAQGLELQVVAAAVVGGVNTFGGQGSMFGAFLGAVLIDVLDQSLIRWLQISEFWRDALLGLLILLAVAADALIVARVRRLATS